jgi:hypothetical protein
MKCKDIPTLPILKFIMEHGGIGCNWNWYGARCVRNAMPDGWDLPDNLVLAKMRNIITKGYIDGCYCGCRGDFEITEKGRTHVESS